MQLDFLGDLRRTHTCGALRASHAGEDVVLMGWVNRRRDLGSLIFIDVRDRTGVMQVVFNRELNTKIHEKASTIRSEFVIAVLGKVKRRDPATINKNIATGEIEVVASELRILNESKTPPFAPGDATMPNEEMRLKYRYLDLRRPEMQANIELRHQVALAIRNYLAGEGFFEIETPFMTRSTPEGARDYLVPSRVHPGQFYALPQSPQLFKQILMISGFDKYFQIVRCFRDEDLRADRQPEFTQIDLEMTFPQQDRVFEVVEGFLKAGFAAAGVELKTPFPRMTYDEAIRQYGSDKPDLRLPPLVDVRDAFAPAALQSLNIHSGLPVVAIRIPRVGELSRKERDEIKSLFLGGNPGERKDAKLFEDFKRLEKSLPQAAEKVRKKCGVSGEAVAQDLIVLVAGGAAPEPHKSEGGIKPEVKQHDRPIYTAAGGLRLALAQKYASRHGAFSGGRKDAASYRLLWVTDFPMFEWDNDGGRWAAAHHPFTSPHERDMAKLDGENPSDLGAVRALAYDVVLNGTELGSGSIRIHRQDIQKKIFRALGMSDEEARSRFGFFLEALEYGTPPHGGIALGLDRIVMILAGADSLREVIPFPKTAKAVDLMVDAPTAIGIGQEEDLELIAAAVHLPQKDRTLVQFCEKLLRVVENNLFSGLLPADTAFQKAMALILAKSFNDATAAIRLAKAGYGPQSAAICRSLVESAINSRYIERTETEQRAISFLKSVNYDNQKLATRLGLHDPSPELQRVMNEVAKFEMESGWPRNVRDRAYDVESPSYAYDIVFLMLSQLVHSSISAMTSQLKYNEDEFSLKVGHSSEWVDTALATVFIFFHQVVMAAFKAFLRNNEELIKLSDDFANFHAQLNEGTK